MEYTLPNSQGYSEGIVDPRVGLNTDMTEGGQKKGIQLTFHRGFFYNVNNRHVNGLNWANNYGLPFEIRECKDSIGIPESFLRRIMEKDLLTIKMYTQLEAYQGSFSITTKGLDYWVKINGLYTTAGGKKMIAVPLSLWKRNVETVPQKAEKQLTMF